MLLRAQDKLDQGATGGGGLEITMPLTLGLIWAILCGDVITDLEYATRPYEVNPGQTDAVLKDCVEYMYGVFRDRPEQGGKLRTLTFHLAGSYLTKALQEVPRRCAAVEVDRTR